ncbi:MAG: hypothetical protein LBQ18_04190 [Campylobacteraceae bacterium]|jgi:hypothetical protein|nr:hypothetical protein [Campylobacteraceae bacterium]
MQNSETKLDIYKEKLKQESQKVLECRQKHEAKSCFECENLIGCESRKAYVQAVYESMSQGQSGGFEF